MEKRLFNIVLIAAGFVSIIILFVLFKFVSTGYAVLESSSASLHNFSTGDFGLLSNGDLISLTGISIVPNRYSYDTIEFTDYPFSNNQMTSFAEAISDSKAIMYIGGKEYDLTYGGSGSNAWVILNNATLINKTMGDNISVGDYVLMDLSKNSPEKVPIQLREVYNEGNLSQNYVLFYSPTGDYYLSPAISLAKNRNVTLMFYNYEVNVTYGGNGINGWAVISKNFKNASSLGCMDSDGGINYYVKGSIQAPGFGGSDYCTGNTLTEYYCDNGYMNATSYNCSSGCLNGACIGSINYSYDPLGNANVPKYSTSGESSTNNVNNTNGSTNLTELNKSENETNILNSTSLTPVVPHVPHVQNVSFYLGSSTTLNISGTNYFFELTNITPDKAVLTVDKLIKYSLGLGQTESIQGFNVTLANITLNPPEGPPSVEVSISEPYGENLSNYNVTISGPHMVNGKLVCSSGCLYKQGCLPYSSRSGGSYCRIDGNMTYEFSSGSSCTNNFECSSNSCVQNKCVPSNFLQAFINWVKSLFGGK